MCGHGRQNTTCQLTCFHQKSCLHLHHIPKILNKRRWTTGEVSFSNNKAKLLIVLVKSPWNTLLVTECFVQEKYHFTLGSFSRNKVIQRKRKVPTDDSGNASTRSHAPPYFAVFLQTNAIQLFGHKSKNTKTLTNNGNRLVYTRMSTVFSPTLSFP